MASEYDALLESTPAQKSEYDALLAQPSQPKSSVLGEIGTAIKNTAVGFVKGLARPPSLAEIALPIFGGQIERQYEHAKAAEQAIRSGQPAATSIAQAYAPNVSELANPEATRGEKIQAGVNIAAEVAPFLVPALRGIGKYGVAGRSLSDIAFGAKPEPLRAETAAAEQIQKGGEISATQERVVKEGNIPKYPGDDTGRASTETGGRGGNAPSPQSEAQAVQVAHAVPQPEQPRIISTAVQTPEGVKTGTTWNQPHDEIAKGITPTAETPTTMGEVTPKGQATVPDFAKRYNPETLFVPPRWAFDKYGKAFEDKIFGLIHAKSPVAAADVTPIWKVMTPAERQELLSRGFSVTNTRIPGQVALLKAKDAVAAKSYYRMQEKRASVETARPSATGETPVATPQGIQENQKGFIIREPDGTERFTNDRTEAAGIAKAAGQVKPENAGTTELHSQQLTSPVSVPTETTEGVRGLQTEEMRRMIEQLKLEGKDFGIPSGMIDEGLNVEYPSVAASIEKYTYENKISGISEAIKDPDYGAYKSQLELLLRRSYGNKPIPVARIEGYSGFSGQGAGDYISVSTNPFWGKHSAKPGKLKLGAVDPRDVVLAGGEEEGELIIKRGSFIPSENVPMESHERFIKGGMTAREIPKEAKAKEIETETKSEKAADVSGTAQARPTIEPTVKFTKRPNGDYDIIVNGEYIGLIEKGGTYDRMARRTVGGSGYDVDISVGGKRLRTSDTILSSLKSQITNHVKKSLIEEPSPVSQPTETTTAATTGIVPSISPNEAEPLRVAAHRWIDNEFPASDFNTAPDHARVDRIVDVALATKTNLSEGGIKMSPSDLKSELDKALSGHLSKADISPFIEKPSPQTPTVTEPTTAQPLPKTEPPLPPETPEQLGQALKEPGRTAGVANRVLQERAAKGEIPQAPAAGQGHLTEDIINKSRAEYSPERALVAAQNVRNGSLSEADAGQVRIHEEALTKIAANAEKALDADPKNPALQEAYNTAKAALTQWHNDTVQPMKTTWSNAGKSMQGETDIDTGSYIGLQKLAWDTAKRDFTAKEEPVMRLAAKRVSKLTDDVRSAISKAEDQVQKVLKPSKYMDLNQLRESLAETLKSITC